MGETTIVHWRKEIGKDKGRDREDKSKAARKADDKKRKREESEKVFFFVSVAFLSNVDICAYIEFLQGSGEGAAKAEGKAEGNGADHQGIDLEAEIGGEDEEGGAEGEERGEGEGEDVEGEGEEEREEEDEGDEEEPFETEEVLLVKRWITRTCTSRSRLSCSSAARRRTKARGIGSTT